MFWKLVPPTENPERTTRELDSVALGEAQMFEASVLNILNEGLGFRKSTERGACLLGDDQKIPMMSYGLIEYLMGLDLSSFDLLELGGGFSTEFWSARVKSVTTLETDAKWAQSLIDSHYPNTEIRVVDTDRIAAEMTTMGRKFDAVIVDAATNRYRCAKAALGILRPGGFILLDNADWYPNTTAMLRDADLIQVDFSDFRPLRWYRCATSLFLHKDFRARPRDQRLPRPLIGGKDIGAVNVWDRIID